MARPELAAALAPLAPPCFEARSHWLTYVETAALHQKRQTGPLIVGPGAAPIFNRNFSFCAECTVEHRSEMLKKNRCDPGYLRKVIPITVEPSK